MLEMILDFMLNEQVSGVLQTLGQLIETLFALLMAFLGSLQSWFIF